MPQIPQTEDVPSEATRTASRIIDNQPSFTYPFEFRHSHKELHSYSTKLHIIEDCENCDELCLVCPAGRSYMRDVEYKLLGTNNHSAIFGCRSVERCQDFLVKVIF